MQIIWSQFARADLRTIRDYLAQHDPETATRMLRAIRSHTALLEQFPALGSPFDRTIRRLSVPRTPYLIAYIIRSDGVFVVRVFDSRQDWQNWIWEH